MYKNNLMQALMTAGRPFMWMIALLLSSCGIIDNSEEENVLIPVASGDTYVYVNNRGEVMTPEVNVLETSAFYGNYAVVGKEKKGYIDRSGKLIIPMQYAEATIFSEGLAFVKETSKSPVIAIDTKGNEVFRLPDAKNARRFKDGLAAFSQKGLWGFVDKTGKTVIEPQYKEVGDFSCGLATAGSRNAYGFINTKGQMVIEPQFNDTDFSFFIYDEGVAGKRFTADGYCVVGTGGRRDGKLGVINTKGEFVIPLTEYSHIVADKGGFIAYIGSYYGSQAPQAIYMDVKGNTLLEGFSRLLPFNSSKYTIALPSGSSEFVIIDRAGKAVAEITFSPVFFQASFVDGMAVAQNGRTAGDGQSIINEKGEKIIDEKRVYVADDYNNLSAEHTYYKLNIY